MSVTETFPTATAENPTSFVTWEFEDQGYARLAPRFSEQLADPSRNDKIKYYQADEYQSTTTDDYGHHGGVSRTTEHESLVELHHFLSDVVERSLSSDDPEAQEAAATAQDILENLTFIGKPEF